MNLDPKRCYEALAARDSRFDGRFFVGVSTTSVYCRPICAVRTPGRDRCSYFSTAAAAEAAGHRPCMRCRPELAPGNAPVDRGRQLAQRAFALIEAGELDQADFDQLAAKLAVSGRQLRRAIGQEYGVNPKELAQTRRLLLAKRLLTETSLRVADVAFASGFSSLRRFNEVFAERYRMTPSRLRQQPAGPAPATITLQLAYRPPLAWAELGQYLASRGARCCEQFDGQRYTRGIRIGEHAGWFSATDDPQRHHLAIEISSSLLPALTPLLTRLRRLFDLDANPQRIHEHLAADPRLASCLQRWPGLRVPGTLDGFEIALRAIIGQQISVPAATTVFGRLLASFGEALNTPFPDLNRSGILPRRLAAASLEEIMSVGLMRRRAQTLQGLAQAIDSGRVQLEPGCRPDETMAALQQLPGIGPWTAQYVAMRALADPDVFPPADLGLLKALQVNTAREMESLSQPWRPWRAYAAIYLWKSLAGND